MADTKEYKDIFKQSGVPKRLLVSFPNISVTLGNEDIVSESMEISESLCSESELRFGSCEASVFKLRIIGNVIPLIGETFTVSMYVGDIAEPLMLGTYKVASDKPTADRKFRDIVAYDAMYDIINTDVAAWYNSILPNENSTTTLRAFRDSFMGHFGIEQEEITLPNDEIVVERTIDPESISGKDVLTAICEINGCFGHIGRNGQMQYITLQEIESGLLPANDLFPMDSVFPYDGNTEKIKEHHYISCQYEDYTTKHIGKLQIRQKENDVGCIIGEGANCYIIEGNFLVFGKSAAGLQAIGQRLFDIISVLWYRPTTVKAVGNPCLEVGAAIRLNTQHEVVETYILERTLKGIQGLVDTYEAQGKEMYSEGVNSVQKSIVQLKGKLNILTRTAEETRSQLINIESNLSSQILQTAEEISAEVKRAKEAEASLSVRADEIVLSVTDLQTNTQSSIQQLSDAISLRVTRGEVSSMISVAVNGITISASQISLEGYTTINGGFSVLSNGSVVIRNGSTSAQLDGNRFEIATSGNGSLRLGSNFMAMYDAGYVETYAIAYISGGKLHIGDGSCDVSCGTINGGVPITSANIHEYI